MRELRALLSGEVAVQYDVKSPAPIWVPLAAVRDQKEKAAA